MCRYLKSEEKKITHHRIKNAAARDKYLSLSAAAVDIINIKCSHYRPRADSLSCERNNLAQIMRREGCTSS